MSVGAFCDFGFICRDARLLCLAVSRAAPVCVSPSRGVNIRGVGVGGSTVVHGYRMCLSGYAAWPPSVRMSHSALLSHFLSFCTSFPSHTPIHHSLYFFLSFSLTFCSNNKYSSRMLSGPSSFRRFSGCKHP